MADGSKTEKPTPRRRQKAREQGQIARSRELMTSAATVAVLGLLVAQASRFPAEWHDLLRRTLGVSAEFGNGPGLGFGFENALPLLRWNGYLVVSTTAAALLLGWGTALLAALAQGGFIFAPASLAPSLERFNPVARVSEMFSLPALGRLLKSLLPVAVVTYLVSAVLIRDWPGVLELPQRNLLGIRTLVFGDLFEIAWKSSLVLLLWAGVDYLIERQRLEGNLRMSRQDLRDEYRDTEGNPAVKSRLRRLQRQLRKRRMLDDVKRASVVIVNPTEFAVALEYRPPMAAPTVVAKGRNLVARQIKEIALWQGIPMVENPPLAHALYRAVEVGQGIPAKLYAVVAGILAAIYRAQEAASRASQATSPARRGS
jgi:flagellar biosynthesis protein FlhB